MHHICTPLRSTYWYWNESYSNGDRNAWKKHVLKLSLQAWASYQPVDVSEEHSDEGGVETPVWVAFSGKTRLWHILGDFSWEAPFWHILGSLSNESPYKYIFWVAFLTNPHIVTYFG